MSFRIVATDLAIDLGTSNIKVYKKGEGVVLNEPSVLVLDHTSTDVLSIGAEAKDMIGKTPDEIIVVRPLVKGVISDFNLAEAMLYYFFQKVNPGFSIMQPKIVICVPSDITDVQARAVEDAALHAGCRDVILVDESLAANYGMGLSPEDPRGILTVDIGAGRTEVALISLNGIVASRSSVHAGDYIDEKIIEFFKEKKGLEIGHNTAEKIKINLMSLKVKDGENSMPVEGRDIKTAKPERIKVESKELVNCILPFADEIVDMIYMVLEQVPPELSADIKNDGFVLTGGMSKLKGLKEYIEKKIGLSSQVSEDPSLDAIKGAGMILENTDRFLKFRK
jgi:rod shape-determining protein MreB